MNAYCFSIPWRGRRFGLVVTSDGWFFLGSFEIAD